jgi:hypothetical protein
MQHSCLEHNIAMASEPFSLHRCHHDSGSVRILNSDKEIENPFGAYTRGGCTCSNANARCPEATGEVEPKHRWYPEIKAQHFGSKQGQQSHTGCAEQASESASISFFFLNEQSQGGGRQCAPQWVVRWVELCWGLVFPFKNSCRGSARLMDHETDREQTVSTRKHFTQRSEGDSRKRNASLCPAGRL